MAKTKVMKKDRKGSKFTSKARIKEPYRDSKGDRVPGVSTVCGMIDKSGPLMYWAWDLGRKGINYRQYRDDLANVGKLLHEMILAYFLGMEADTYVYSQWEIDKANNSFQSFLNFISKYKVKPIHIEHEIISDLLRYGGRLDYYGGVDDVLTVMDFKTGKRMYDEQMFQCGGYHLLLKEKKLKVDQYIIVNIPRSKGEAFEVAFLRNMEPAVRVFKGALEIYWAIKDAKAIMKESVETIKVKDAEKKKEDPIHMADKKRP